MKRIVCLLLVLMLIASLAACGKKAVTSGSSEQTSSSVSNDVATNEVNNTPKSNYKLAPFTVEPQKIYDTDVATITVTGVNVTNSDDLVFNVDIKNNSSRVLSVSSLYIIVNGLTLPASLYETLESGKQSSVDLTIYDRDLSISGIKEFADVTVYLELKDQNSLEDLDKCSAHIKTSTEKEGYREEFNITKPIYTKDGLQIEYKEKVNLSDYGDACDYLIFKVKNDNKFPLEANVSEAYLNDTKVNAHAENINVAPNSCSYMIVHLSDKSYSNIKTLSGKVDLKFWCCSFDGEENYDSGYSDLVTIEV